LQERKEQAFDHRHLPPHEPASGVRNRKET
jgi:hypothetical protein